MQRITLGRGVRLQQPAACLTAANLDKRRALGCADVARKLAAGSKRAALGGLGHIRRAAGDGLQALALILGQAGDGGQQAMV